MIFSDSVDKRLFSTVIVRFLLSDTIGKID